MIAHPSINWFLAVVYLIDPFIHLQLGLEVDLVIFRIMMIWVPCNANTTAEVMCSKNCLETSTESWIVPRLRQLD